MTLIIYIDNRAKLILSSLTTTRVSILHTLTHSIFVFCNKKVKHKGKKPNEVNVILYEGGPKSCPISF